MRLRHEDRERLEQEIRGSAYLEVLQELQRHHLFFHQFRTWGEVIAFMRGGTSRDPEKDRVLRPIFQAHAEDADPRLRTILLVIFWPGLESIHWKKRSWDRDPDERWQTIVWTFLQVVCRVDVKQRPDRLVQKVFNDTVHRFYEECQRSWAPTNGEIFAEPEEIEFLAAGPEYSPVVAFERSEEEEVEIRRLRKHVEAGRISESDFLLIVGLRLYGKSVAEYARETGLGYQVAKKRRLRAEMVIRRFEEEE